MSMGAAQDLHMQHAGKGEIVDIPGGTGDMGPNVEDGTPATDGRRLFVDFRRERRNRGAASRAQLQEGVSSEPLRPSRWASGLLFFGDLLRDISTSVQPALRHRPRRHDRDRLP